MKELKKRFPKTYVLPYQLGVYLAVNAVRDVCLVVDGLNCVLPKADLLAGNHDLNSTLLSPLGRHRVVCTMTGPLPQQANPEQKLSRLLESAAGSGEYGAVLVTGLPFMNLAGMDYDGVAAGVKARVPVAAVPALSLEGDWLDGYDRALEALVGALSARRSARKKRSVAVVGYMHDRGEADHRANLAELRRILRLAGLEPACILPDGGSFADWRRALSAGLVVSLPYGRRAAARLAALTGARLVETGLPAGLEGTTAWLAALRRAAGLAGLPPEVRAAEREAALALSRAADALVHSGLIYAGDPYLLRAVGGFAGELGMRVQAAFLNCRSRRLPAGAAPPLTLFSPPAASARAAAAALKGYDRPALAVCDSFALSEGFAAGAAEVEFGFPSYTRHCLYDEPFLGYAGAVALGGRLLNASLRRGERDEEVRE
ncbi:MAG: hypothetical protein FD189_248 [Elusimicrobia bacterium]|nr:MAG: hypothetical protein FD154_48 [Elusimicrobiota bacterium]KAF0157981.1 MAG: hypothetical protein FD189_248 [Elusimicrobiota bacterium]